MHDPWEALNSAKESPRTVPDCPQHFLYLSQDPGPQESSQNLCSRSWGEVRTQEKPKNQPGFALQTVPGKERLHRKVTGTFGEVVPPCPNCPCIGRGCGCSELVQHWLRGFGMTDFPVEAPSWLRGFSCTGSGMSHVHTPGADGSKRGPVCPPAVGTPP